MLLHGAVLAFAQKHVDDEVAATLLLLAQDEEAIEDDEEPRKSAEDDGCVTLGSAVARHTLTTERGDALTTVGVRVMSSTASPSQLACENSMSASETQA